MEVILKTDGGSRGNPGPAGSGFVLLEGGFIVHSEGHYYKSLTNNEAEYMGLIDGLKYLTSRKRYHESLRTLYVLSDSLLLVNQVKGRYQVHNARLIELHKQVKGLLAKFSPEMKLIYEWVSRAANTEADAMANKAMDEERTIKL